MVYNDDDLAYALQRIKDGEAVRKVSREMGIPSSTLHDHVSGKSSTIGKGSATALTRKEERRIVKALQFADACNKGLDRDDLKSMVKEYLDGCPER